MAIRVLLVDDQALFREGLNTILSLQPDIVIVGEASNGQEALVATAIHQPDVILMDLSLPGIDGWELARLLFNQLIK